MLTARLASLAALSLLSACAATVPRPPAILDEAGEPLWKRVETEHFVVESNVAADSSIRSVAREFETLWHAFTRIPVLGLRPPEERPLVVMLRDSAESDYVLSRSVAGMCASGTPLGTVIVVSRDRSPFGTEVLKHELAHFVMSEFLPNSEQYRWLNEGLAQFMETADYDVDDGEIIFGDFSRPLLAAARHRVPAAYFVGPWPDDVPLGLLYGRSWLLVHYLIDDHLEDFLDFLARASKDDDWRSAWLEELPLPLETLDEQLDRYFRRESYGLWRTVALSPDLRDLEVTPVPLADAHALRAFLAGYFHSDRDHAEAVAEARVDLRSALALERHNERARRVEAMLRAHEVAEPESR